MKIALSAAGFSSWGGGIHFLRIVADALRADISEGQEIFVLNPKLDSRAFAHITVKALRELAQARFSLTAHLAARRLASRNVSSEFFNLPNVTVLPVASGSRAVVRHASRLNLDVLIPTLTPLGRNAAIPWVGYLYDFQHKYLPQLFSPKALNARDRAFARMLDQARCVIVNAKAVERDVRKFFPDSKCEVVALPFSAAPRAEWMENRPSTLQSYGLSRPYFLISNQFWLHKDHRTAFEAFKIFSRRNGGCDLVCTGATSDPRDPEYFGRLLSKLEHDGTRKRTHILGMIPKRDQIEIMKNALAVIQPTLFEGGPGGGAVFDAVSLGKHSIVSDIPVNLELPEESVEFFKAGDAEDLCRSMLSALARTTRQPSSDELMKRGEDRLRRCGTALKDAIASVR